MALLHSNESTIATDFNELHFNNFKAVNGLDYSSDYKWMYLVSNRIRFSQKLSGAIRVQMPDESVLYEWMTKIVLGGQCSILFVEELNLEDFRTLRFRQLCEQHGVTLVNLTIDDVMPENLVVGPWN